MLARYLTAFSLIAVLGVGLLAGCSKKERGQKCYNDDECKEGLTCTMLKCWTPEDVAEWHRQLAEEQEGAKRAEMRRNQNMLKQSGVEVAAQVERPAAPADATAVGPGAGGPGAVRVAHTKSQGKLVFAACRPEERLVGGGCLTSSDDTVLWGSYPSDFGAADTLGARWNCQGKSKYVDYELEAFALCVTPAKPEER